MTEVASPEVRPASDSLSGVLNGYIFFCGVVEQQMYYPSCLCRLGALDAPDVKTPDDWNACKQGRKSNSCKAHHMRQEELLQNKAIYFRDRNVIHIETGKEWRMPGVGRKADPVVPKAVEPTPPSLTKAIATVDTLPTYADALKTAPEPVLAAPAAPRKAPIVSLPGETPLQTARRLAAARQPT